MRDFVVSTPYWSRRVKAASPRAAAEAAVFAELYATWRTGVEFRLPFVLRIVPPDVAPDSDEALLAWSEHVLACIVNKVMECGRFPAEFVREAERARKALHGAVESRANLRLLRSAMLKRSAPPGGLAETGFGKFAPGGSSG